MRQRGVASRVLAIVAALGLALGLAACGTDESGGGGGSASAASVTLRLGYAAPATHPYGQAMDFFVNAVRKASDGAIDVRTLPSYRGGDIPLLNDVQGGTVDMASVSSAVWGTQGVHAFDALQAMLLIDRYDLERRVITGRIGRDMLRSTDRLGLVGLAIHEGGLRKPLGASRRLRGLGDYRGLRVGSAESPVLETGLRALGASPTPIPLPEAYSALRDGAVDAMEASLGLVQTDRLYEVARYVTANVSLWPFPTILVMNRSKFDALSTDQQTIIRDAAARVPGFSIGLFERPSDLPQSLCDEGVRFVVASDADLAALSAAARSVVRKLSRDAEVSGYIHRIAALKSRMGAPPEAAPLPAGCTIRPG